MALDDSRTLSVAAVVTAITYAVGLLGILPVVRHIGMAFSIAFLCLFAFSACNELKKLLTVPRWALNAVSLAVIGLSVLRLAEGDLIMTTAEALIVLLGIKFLEVKRFRDYMQIYAIAVFLLAGSSLFSLDITFLLFFIAMVFLLAVAVVMLTYFAEDPGMRLDRRTAFQILLRSLAIPAAAMPLTVVMFIALPRTSYPPLLGFLNRADRGKTGFTDQVALGSVSGIQEDEGIIFRAKVERLPEEVLYWRGIVLDTFDGTRWRASGAASGTGTPRITGRKITQEVYLEPYGNRYLFGLDKPLRFSPSLVQVKSRGDLSAALPVNVERRMRYEVVSVLSDTVSEEGADPARYLQLPGGLSSRVTGLAGTVSAGKDARGAALGIQRFLRDGGYRHSLENLPVTATPLDDFLFDLRYGNCEYFASAMATMLRSAGVPSRIVGGYRGGYYNEVGRYYAVTQKNAHVWVEAFLEGEGWVRFDPTPAPPGFFTALQRGSLLFRLRLLIDTLDYYWNAAVIGYDFRKQVSLFRKVRAGLSWPSTGFVADPRTAARYAGGLLVVAAAAVSLYYLYRSRKSRPERLVGLFLRRMERHGYRRRPCEGLEEFVSRVTDRSLRERASGFVKAFDAQYYRDRVFTREVMRSLRERLREV